MARLLFTAAADADLDGILTDLAEKAGRRTVAKYLARFDRLYGRLTAHPASGPPRRTLGPSVRIGVVAPYVVIYDHAEASDVVIVLRIVHGRRRISGSLLREG